MPRVTINGNPCQTREGATILEASRELGVSIPTLCHDDRLAPIGACRLCVVDIKDTNRHASACNTKVAEGMIIETHSPAVEKIRHTLLHLLAHEYPVDAVDASPEKPFHRYLRQYAIDLSVHKTAKASYQDASHPYLQVDMHQCINCYRCVRICDDVQGQFVWHASGRGHTTQILPASGTTLLESGCVGCGACSDTCPTGAIEDKTIFTNGAPDHWSKTTCPYCGTGCEMLVGTRGNKIVQVKPVLESPVSKGHLCIKGRYAFEFVNATDRITDPMIRDNGVWRKTSWAKAIGTIATQFQRIRRDYGPDTIGMLGSARATNEENYLTQKFARVVIGTNNVDCCARVCHAPTAAGMKMMLGTGAATNSFDDIEQAATFLICGCNPTENHPIVGARIKQAVIRGAKLIIVDPRKIELAHYASLHLQLRPGTNVPLLNAIAQVIISENLVDQTVIHERIRDYQAFRDFIAAWTPERAAVICGLQPEQIRQAARLYASHKPSMCFHGLGITEHIQGTDGVMCLVNLALLTGNFGRPGAGVNPLRGQNNVQGAAHMGCEPQNLTGYVPLSEGKDVFEAIWQSPLPQNPGLNLMEMIGAASKEQLKALWAIGYDVALTNPDSNFTRAALAKLDFVVVQDIFFNELAKEFGHVFLPACSSFEKDGTFMNSERRVQRVRKAIDPMGNSQPDWKIICNIADAMGSKKQFTFESSEEIWNEIRKVWKAGAGITYDRLEIGGLQWPCPDENHPGTSILHANAFPSGKTAPLKSVNFEETKESLTPEFPYLLTTGRTLYQFNAGTMTMRTANVQLRGEDTLDISPGDATVLELRDGDSIRLRSRHGETVMPVRIDPRVKAGELFATFHSANIFLNRVTGSDCDRHVQTPEYKVTAVRVEKL